VPETPPHATLGGGLLKPTSTMRS